MIALHTRASCDECGGAPAVVQVDDTFFLCASCEAIIIDSVASVVPMTDVKVPVAESRPRFNAAGTSNSAAARRAPESNPGPSLATGMSRDAANAGGDHEAVTVTSLEQLKTSAALETTSLPAVGVDFDDKHTGTAPGACGPERDIFGATNSSSGDGPASNSPGRLDREGRVIALCAPAVTGNSSCGVEGSRDLKSSGIDDCSTLDGSQTVAAPRSRLAGIASGPQDSIPDPSHPPASANSVPCSSPEAAPLSLPVDPELDAVISQLEADWFAKGISLADLTFPMLKNSMTLRVTQDSLIQAPASSAVSNPSSFSVGA